MWISPKTLDDLIVPPSVVEKLAEFCSLGGLHAGHDVGEALQTKVLMLHILAMLQGKIEEDPLDRFERRISTVVNAFQAPFDRLVVIGKRPGGSSVDVSGELVQSEDRG